MELDWTQEAYQCYEAHLQSEKGDILAEVYWDEDEDGWSYRVQFVGEEAFVIDGGECDDFEDGQRMCIAAINLELGVIGA